MTYFIIALHGPGFSRYWTEKPELGLMDEAAHYETREAAEDALQLVPTYTAADEGDNDVDLQPEILEMQIP